MMRRTRMRRRRRGRGRGRRASRRRRKRRKRKRRRRGGRRSMGELASSIMTILIRRKMGKV